MLVLLVTPGGCVYTVKTPSGVVRVIDEDHAVSVVPMLTAETVPTASDPLMNVKLARKVRGPVYEIEVSDEESKRLSYSLPKQIGTILATGLTGGLLLLLRPVKTLQGLSGLDTKTVGTRQVRGEPRKTGEMGELEAPWPGGLVSVDVNGVVSRDFVTDGQGTVAVNVTDAIGLLGESPRTAVTIRMRAASTTDRDEKIVRLDRETSRSLYLQSVDMSAETSTGIAQPVLSVYLDEGGLVGQPGRPVTLVVEAVNRGNGVTSQLRGVIRSPEAQLNGKEILLGKILPGMRRTWFDVLTLPASMARREIPLTITFSERNGAVPDRVVTRIVVGDR